MTNPVQPETTDQAVPSMQVCALASGSKGNCIYVGCGDTHILVDCGIAMRDITGGLNTISEKCSAPFAPGDIDAILVTHEHSDHIRSCASLACRLNVPVYATAHTLEAINAKARTKCIPENNLRVISGGQDFYIGNINVTPFSTPHDVSGSLGFRFDAGAASVAIATDIGKVADSWINVVEGAQVVLLESNHDIAMLKSCEQYNETLKKRILSDRGHLSNVACGQAAIRLTKSGTRVLLLSHLSENTNTPELAFETVCDELRGEGITPGRDVYVGVLYQHSMSGIFEISC